MALTKPFHQVASTGPTNAYAIKPIQAFNWALSADTPSMPIVIPSQAAAKVEAKGIKVTVPEGSEENKKSPED